MSKSYVISVALATGRYRHIQIDETASLDALHQAIWNAFGLEGNHPYWFNMENKAERAAEPTGQATLAALNLKKEKKFKYVSEFRTEHPFQCRILREQEGETETPAVLRKAGQAPEWFFERETVSMENETTEIVAEPVPEAEVRETARPQQPRTNGPLLVEMESVRAYQMSQGAFGSFVQERVRKVGRNEPCPCGSGKKYKKCCGR